MIVVRGGILHHKAQKMLCSTESARTELKTVATPSTDLAVEAEPELLHQMLSLCIQ
jgi:hypothetical protein